MWLSLCSHTSHNNNGPVLATMRKLRFYFEVQGPNHCEIIDIYKAKPIPRRSTSPTTISFLETKTFNNNNSNNNHLTLGTLRFLPRRCASAARSLHPTTGELNHALSQAPVTTLPQLSRPMLSGQTISMERGLPMIPHPISLNPMPSTHKVCVAKQQHMITAR